MIAINATELNFAELGFSGFGCLFGFGFELAGMELGEEEIVLVGLLPGFSGEAIAPSDPGFVGSVPIDLHGCIGDPQRAWF